MECGVPAVEVKAAETVLGYTIGKPRQQTDVSVSMSAPAAAHLSALQKLAQLADHVAQRVPLPDANPLIAIPFQDDSAKHDINDGALIEGELVTLTPDNADKSKA